MEFTLFPAKWRVYGNLNPSGLFHGTDRCLASYSTGFPLRRGFCPFRGMDNPFIEASTSSEGIERAFNLLRRRRNA